MAGAAVNEIESLTLLQAGACGCFARTGKDKEAKGKKYQD